MITDGIPSKNGPKKGIILVIHSITDISSVYSIVTIVKIINVNMPIIRESNIFPSIDYPKVSLLIFAILKICFALSSWKKAKIIVLDNANSFSLSINI